MNLRHYTTEELRAMEEACGVGSEEWLTLRGILDTREADEYATEAENNPSKTSAGLASDEAEELSFMPWTAYWPG